jgi:hypothetical protein
MVVISTWWGFDGLRQDYVINFFIELELAPIIAIIKNIDIVQSIFGSVEHAFNNLHGGCSEDRRSRSNWYAIVIRSLTKPLP